MSIMLRLVEYSRTYFYLSKEWLSDSEICKLVHAGELPSEEDRLIWYQSLPNRSDYLIWGIEYNGQPIGVCGLKHISNRRAEYWGYIGIKTLWGKGIGKLIMEELINRAFELNIDTLWLYVRKFNERAIRLYMSCGFVIDAELPETYHMILTDILRNNVRYHKMNKNYRKQ